MIVGYSEGFFDGTTVGESVGIYEGLIDGIHVGIQEVGNCDGV